MAADAKSRGGQTRVVHSQRGAAMLAENDHVETSPHTFGREPPDFVAKCGFCAIPGPLGDCRYFTPGVKERKSFRPRMMRRPGTLTGRRGMRLKLTSQPAGLQNSPDGDRRQEYPGEGFGPQYLVASQPRLPNNLG